MTTNSEAVVRGDFHSICLVCHVASRELPPFVYQSGPWIVNPPVDPNPQRCCCPAPIDLAIQTYNNDPHSLTYGIIRPQEAAYILQSEDHLAAAVRVIKEVALAQSIVCIWVNTRPYLVADAPLYPFDDAIIWLLSNHHVQSIELAHIDEVGQYISKGLAAFRERKWTPARTEASRLRLLPDPIASIWAAQLSTLKGISPAVAQEIAINTTCMGNFIKWLEKEPLAVEKLATLTVRKSVKPGRTTLGKAMAERLSDLYSISADASKNFYAVDP